VGESGGPKLKVLENSREPNDEKMEAIAGSVDQTEPFKDQSILKQIRDRFKELYPENPFQPWSKE
jgi:hypothetical protein